MTPEITISRGYLRECFCCREAHDVNVAIGRARWICAPCSKAIWRVGAVLLRAEKPLSSVAELKLEPCNPLENGVANGDAGGGGT